MASITINEGAGGDLKELLETNKKILESLESSRQIILGMAAVLVNGAEGSSEVNFPTAPPSPTVGLKVPAHPPVPPAVYVEDEDEPQTVLSNLRQIVHQPKAEEPIVYSEDFATNEESGLIAHTDEEREKIDMEAQLRELGIEIDDASIPFPLEMSAGNKVGEV